MSESLSDAFLQQIGQEFGTPVYIYHAEKIAEQYQRLKTAFKKSDVVFFYACKALTNISILRYAKSLGLSIDCSSINEVKLAMHAGFSPANTLYTSNGISFQEIAEAKDLGVHINIDSLSNLEKFGIHFGHSYPVGIRLRPNIMAGGNIKISTGHTRSKFGIPVEQIDKVLALVHKYNLHIRDLHIHTGSDIKDVDVFVRGIEVLFDIIPKFNELECIDLGGGFKVPYQQNEHGTDIENLARRVEEAFANHPNPNGKHLQIWFEPGKFLVSECGVLLSRVNVLKETDSIVFAGIDTGLNHLIRPMFYGAHHTIRNVSNPHGPLKPYHVVGNICETDTFAEDRLLPEVREGDFLVFENAGAYGYQMASNYNSRFRPAEVLVKEGRPHLIRSRENFRDLLSNQLEIDV